MFLRLENALFVCDIYLIRVTFGGLELDTQVTLKFRAISSLMRKSVNASVDTSANERQTRCCSLQRIYISLRTSSPSGWYNRHLIYMSTRE